ncbi:helix-turn-helix domain-containing protein [Fimbriiglobus ruber]|uniref:Helix-turn-helix domain-containing protein n=1 Tax=Fimbriiglobus ruber TaxID=1908690 RepID=A0A225DFT5_9BACT|nr:helix-turn-helix domain-containing protein [Fimbriiglobus ruber]OWK39833.1 hypothetical protein FRUB_05723 [Fimbriiglobus ruber]OWK40197.1 hypothetical protein FRUB_05116 [Fimbriiglobus ruber]
MPGRKPTLTPGDIARAFAGESPCDVPRILTTRQAAALCQVSVKTFYEWVAKGRLEGTFRRRGKHCLFWRDKVIDKLFNGGDWTP